MLACSCDKIVFFAKFNRIQMSGIPVYECPTTLIITKEAISKAVLAIARSVEFQRAVHEVVQAETALWDSCGARYMRCSRSNRELEKQITRAAKEATDGLDSTECGAFNLVLRVSRVDKGLLMGANITPLEKWKFRLQVTRKFIDSDRRAATGNSALLQIADVSGGDWVDIRASTKPDTRQDATAALLFIITTASAKHPINSLCEKCPQSVSIELIIENDPNRSSARLHA